MSQWPPPPDLDSLKELFAAADIEGLIGDAVIAAPADEYDPEAKRFFEAIENHSTDQLTVQHTLPVLEQLWINQFSLDDNALAQRRPALLALAQQIERFFGPEARPQVRS